MTFMEWIVQRLNDASSFFYNLYLESYYSFYIPEAVGDLFYSLSTLFANLAWDFWDFSNWVNQVAYEVTRILGEWEIKSLLKKWLDWAELAYAWVSNAYGNVYAIIEGWWVWWKDQIELWIAEAKQFLQAQLDSLSTWVSYLATEWDSFKITTLPTLANWTGVEDLIRTWFANFTPFWEGWQEWRDKVIEFIQDPQQWFYDRLEELFDRFW